MTNTQHNIDLLEDAIENIDKDIERVESLHAKSALLAEKKRLQESLLVLLCEQQKELKQQLKQKKHPSLKIEAGLAIVLIIGWWIVWVKTIM